MGEGRFRPVIVTTGGERNGQTEILSGLEAGQQVVASGQFLIDSEANLRGVLARLAGDGGQGMEDGGKQVSPTPIPQPPFSADAERQP